MIGADAIHLNRSPFVKALTERLATAPVSYLAHEYMNEQWKPVFMADVAAALADAKLQFVASSQLYENFPTLTLTPDQQAVADRFEDPVMREMVKDMCLERSLRHDIFVRGARRLDNAGRDAALMNLSVALGIHPDDLPLQVQMPAGQAQLNPEFYQPIAREAANGPARVSRLLALPDVAGRRDNPAELLGIMVGLELADVLTRPDAEPGAAAMRFNQVSARRFVQSENLGRTIGLASHRAGAGVGASLLDLVVMERLRAGQANMEDLVRQIAPPAEHLEALRRMIDDSLRKRMPILRAAGVF